MVTSSSYRAGSFAVQADSASTSSDRNIAARWPSGQGNCGASGARFAGRSGTLSQLLFTCIDQDLFDRVLAKLPLVENFFVGAVGDEGGQCFCKRLLQLLRVLADADAGILARDGGADGDIDV